MSTPNTSAVKNTTTAPTAVMTPTTTHQSTVLVTGASRGLGLGLVEVYATRGWRVIAAARDPAKADQLQALAKAQPHGRVAVVALDISDTKSVATLPAQLQALQVSRVDLLVNNAGIACPIAGLDGMSVDLFLSCYRTNVVGNWDVTQRVLPFLRLSPNPRVAHITSNGGSITDTLDMTWPGGLAAYRASKAALNNLAAVQSREYNAATVAALSANSSDAKGKPKSSSGAAAAPAASSPAALITVVLVHPGWVDTAMGNSGGKPALSVAESATGCANAIAAAPVNAKATFVTWEGKPMAW